MLITHSVYDFYVKNEDLPPNVLYKFSSQQISMSYVPSTRKILIRKYSVKKHSKNTTTLVFRCDIYNTATVLRASE